MKNKILLLMACCAMVVSCSKYDDSSLWDKVNDLDNRVSYLERLCQEMNTNISSLHTLVSALQTGDYITSVTPIIRGAVEVGYTITFKNSPSITIYHGENGQDGSDGQNGTDGQNGADGRDGVTPIIGVALYTDENYYWTIQVGNNPVDWLRDGYGQMIRANVLDGKDGQDGKDGTNGITPLLKIENDYWYVSTDNGETWTNIGKATGEDGDAFFQNVIDGEYNVTFILANGDTITIPKNKVAGISFQNPRSFAPGEVKDIPYTLTGDANISVVGVPQDWNMVVDTDNSKFVITAPATITNSHRIEAAILVTPEGQPAGVYPSNTNCKYR